jgi:hypothetical protein
MSITECCLNFTDLSALVAAFENEGFTLDTESGAMYTSASVGTFVMIDDCGSGCRWDAENNQLSGAWCCFYPVAPYVLPSALEQYVFEDIGNCCWLAIRNG